MNKYLFEIYEYGYGCSTAEYHEEYGNTMAEAEAKIMVQFPKAYVLQVFTPYKD